MLKNVGESQFKKLSILSLIVLLFLTGFFLLGFTKLKVDYDFEKFFPSSDNETEFFNSFRNKFESDNDFILLSIENHPTVFDWRFLSKIKNLQDRLSSVQHVEFVKSIVSEKELYIFPGGAGIITRPYINFKNKHLVQDEHDLMENEEMVNTFVAKDKKSICLFIRHKDFLSKAKSDQLVVDINKVLTNFSFDKVRMAGRTVGQKFYIDTLTAEMVFFLVVSLLLVLLVLYIAFKSAWGILLPLIVILGTVIWVVGFIGWYGEPVSIVMSILPSIIFVVAMSDVIHLLSRYLDAFRTGIGKYESIKMTIREVGLATFLTSFTTAIGFFSLYFVNVQPIKVFGFVAGLGVMIAFVLTFVLLPILIYFSPDPKFIRSSDKDPFWRKRLAKWFVWVLRKRNRILILTALFTVITIVGSTQMEANNFLMDEIAQNAPIKKDFNYLDNHYGGVRPFEAAISFKHENGNFWNLKDLNAIDSLETYIESVYGARVKFSLVKVIKLLNRSSHAGRIDYYNLPENQFVLNRYKRILKKTESGKLYRGILDSTETFTRISGNIPDWGNLVITAKNGELEKYLQRTKLDQRIKVRITGTAHLLDKNINYLSMSLIQGLTFSVLVVALIMGLLYRSFAMVVISIIPNLIPLIFIAAVMGYFQIHLKTSTSIIFTIAFGIAVDDTIHYLGKFKFELMKGRTMLYAMKRSYLTTGKAMVMTTFVLCAGFVLLIFSSFQGTIFMGIMLCLSLFVALIADLALLPVLLLLFYKKKLKPIRKSGMGD